MSAVFDNKAFIEILERKGCVIDPVLATSGREKHITELSNTLLGRGVTSDEILAEAYSEITGIPYVDLTLVDIPENTMKSIPASYLYRYGVVPYSINNNMLTVVVSDPFDLFIPDKIEALTGYQVRLLISSRTSVDETLKRMHSSDDVLNSVSEDFSTNITREDDADGLNKISLDDLHSDAGVTKLVNTIVISALQRRASDIHIEIFENNIVVKYRVDGVLYPAINEIDVRHHSRLISRIKIMAELDIAEKRIPQDGRITLNINNKDIDFRVSILPGGYGEDVVIRILDKSAVSNDQNLVSLDDLGFDEEIIKKFRKSINEPYGMVLITGPTGSGKTTTLYGALCELDENEVKVITIEDPVEYQFNGIVQIPVNEKKGLTFAKGLRSILRHDPDKIMVGEIRDLETAQIAVQSALTGHLVFTTVHANNSFDVIGRFKHMGVDTYSFVSALNCVMAQRLVRTICPNCKNECDVSDQLLESSGLDPRYYRDRVWYEGSGCSQCNYTGYLGRTSVTECLEMTSDIREMIIGQSTADEIRDVAKKSGMVTLREAALKKVMDGTTTLREINRVTFVD